MIKKRHLAIISAIVAVLLGGLLYNSVAQAQIGRPRTYKDSVEITALDQSGVHVFTMDIVLPFAFQPKETLLNITDVWATVTVGVYSAHDYKLDIVLNSKVTTTSEPRWCYTHSLAMFSMHIEDQSVNNTIREGINKLKVTNPQYYDSGWKLGWMKIFKVSVFIEYEYQPR